MKDVEINIRLSRVPSMLGSFPSCQLSVEVREGHASDINRITDKVTEHALNMAKELFPAAKINVERKP